MNSDDLKKEIEKFFPFVDKPRGIELSFHKDDCLHCKYLREELEQFEDRELDEDGIREIYSEMSCLSAKGWEWAFPSYLRFCLKQEPRLQANETEFLIYNLAPQPEYEKETSDRLSGFSKAQLRCLLEVVSWWQSSEYWSDYCGEDLARASKFISGKLNA